LVPARAADNGTWGSVRVTSTSGPTACLALLFTMGIDTHFTRLREPGPGEKVFAIHIAGESPR